MNELREDSGYSDKHRRPYLGDEYVSVTSNKLRKTKSKVE